MTALPDSLALEAELRRFAPYAPTLALVVDSSPSMRVWEPTVTAFRHLAEAVFTGVRAHTLKSFRDDRGRSQPDGQLIIVLTDGLDPFWAQRDAGALLRAWGSAVPVAIVNPYPEERWHRSNLAPRKLQLSASHAMATNAELQIREPARWINPFDEPRHESAVAIPLLELSARWLDRWASLVDGTSRGWLDLVAYIADPDRSPGPAQRAVPVPAPTDVDPQDLVFQFRAEASAQAFRLATYVASVPLDLDALRAIQGVLLPESRPLHLAEVVTSPLLIRAGDDLTFRPGVREALLACAARDDTVRVVQIVSDLHGDRLPAVRDLSTVLASPDRHPDTAVAPATLPFAQLELAVLRALSGPYAARAGRLQEAIARMSPEPPAEPIRIRPVERTTHPVHGPGPVPIPTSIHSLLQPEADAAVWGNLPPRNGDFTGREDLLAALDRRLRRRQVTAVLPQALHGMGGVGKSQIATEYAYRHRADFDVVWFVPAEQPSQILRALSELGKRLNVDVSQDANTAVREVKRALQAGTPYANWLLIFDNAETIETVREYLPQGGTGKVLVTSRNEEWTSLADALEIGAFSRGESIALLRKRNPTMSPEQADALAELLDDLPLAIGQAAAWRATTDTPVEDYLLMLRETRARLEPEDHPEEYEVAVAAAWTVALERLDAENPVAVQLLQACSFMAPEPISLELFQGPRNVNISPEMDATLQKPSRLNRAFRQIERYGLARTDYREKTIQLHRLVRNVVIGRLTPEGQEDMRHAAHLFLAGGNPGNPDALEHRARFHALLPHVRASDISGCEDEWARQLANDIIAFLFFWGDQTGCREYAAEVVDRWNTMLAPEDPQILKAARWLGHVERVLGNFAAAARIDADCLEKLRSTTDPDDEDTLDAMSLVAADRRAAGDFAGAVDLDREAYEISERVFGPDYPHTLSMAHALGVSLRATGDFSAALERDMDTVRRRVEVLGADHPLTLLTQNGLTLDLRERGEYVAANEQQESLYERTHRALGAGHQYTLMAARNLAVSRRRAGKHEDARKLAMNTMDSLRSRYGELNPEAIACALNYAVDLRENDQVVESRELAERTWHEYAETLGENHPYTLYARTNLGIVLRLLGDVAMAFEHDSAAFEGLRNGLGDDHVLTLTCATNLGSDLSAMGDHNAAYRMDLDTLQRSEGRLGIEHPSTLACSLNLAFDLRALGRGVEGDQRFDAVIEAYRRVLGPEHPAIAAAEDDQRANCDVDPMPL
ncbi:FxSxx-COOH system tetratricopeptide repeat protein [Actinoplanes sp. NPDC049265]|uniref:FxSxx-COOH system tetratricopeptide repeat protein n=1 Tax=Actinoplanes sp. NPDC049265 TaxID=3363902 RepID=UPI00371AFA59